MGTSSYLKSFAGTLVADKALDFATAITGVSLSPVTVDLDLIKSEVEKNTEAIQKLIN